MSDEIVLTPDETNLILAEKLFMVYGGLEDKPEKALNEWNILYSYQREQWIATAKFVLSNYYPNPPLYVDTNAIF